MTRQIVVLQEAMLRMAELTHERRERRATAICNVQKEERALPRSSHRLTAVMGEILGVSPVQQALRAHQYVYDTVYETWNTLSKYQDGCHQIFSIEISIEISKKSS